ncbi:chaperonin 10-like protein [Helicostylum pulchrum]|nr:chaperonin 10-like protein [Helicostylum pulchrum]
MTDTLTGWAATTKDAPLVQMQLPLPQWNEHSVDMDISHCGMCGSDIHTLDEDWGPTAFPCVVGHEIVGIVTRVGDKVANIKVGDRGGVGPLAYSCQECDTCLEGHQNCCERVFVGTYNGNYPNGDKSFGGYADKWRGDGRWVFKVPDNMSSADASSFFCAGVTSYAPLKKFNVNEKSVVGVLGLGGLGHFGVLFAKAMGATVIGLSHNDNKKETAKELGCDDYINTHNEFDLARYRKKFTHILCTGTGSDFQWSTYYNLLHINGHFMNVAAPEWKFPEIIPIQFITQQISISGSAAGSPATMQEMINFAAEKEIKPWITTYKMSDVNTAISDLRAGKPRFRFVLEN